MMDGYTIRAAREDELEKLPPIELAAALLHAASFDGAALLPATAVAELERARARGQLLVAADADGPVGFLILAPLDDDLYLEEVDVHPAHGRRGVGRALVEAAIAQARAAGARQLVLSTKRDLAFNGPFYASVGFRALGDDELWPRLREMRAAEAARGLPIERRVFMIHPL